MAQTDQKSHVQDFFDNSDGWSGKFYRDIHNPFGQMLVRRKYHVLRLYEKYVGPKASMIFDAGCGPGEYLGELGGGNARVFGMDASEEMIRTSGKRMEQKGWKVPPGLIRGDIEHVPLRSGVFDAVLCIGVLGYLHNDEPSLSEFHRLLKPGGHLLLNVRNLNALTSVHYVSRLKVRYLLRHGWRRFRSMVSMATHTRAGGWTSRAYHARRLEATIASMGFTCVEGTTFGYELKVLGRLGMSGRMIVRLERWMDTAMMAMPVRALRYCGWGYIGVFRKNAGA